MASRLGLSIGAYSEKESPYALLQMSAGGRAVQSFPLEKMPEGAHKGGGLRGRIGAFSKASRRRLLWTIAQLQKDTFRCAVFLTVTYPPGEFTPRQSKHHLELYIKRIKYHFPGVAGVWKMEYQKNGTQHYHFLLVGVEFWDRYDAAHCWADVVKSQHPKHEAVSTRVERVGSQRQASYYMAKYVSKDAAMPSDHYGRVWGTFGAIESIMAEKVVIALDKSQLVQLRRLFDTMRRHDSRKAFKRQSNLAASQRWFMDGDSALVVASRLCDLPELLEPPPERVAVLN